MFAVPGWSSAPAHSSASQTTDTPKSTIKETESIAEPAESAANQNSKKRKRGNGKSKAPEINGDNLAELWETVIEGKPKSKSNSTNQSKKRQKIADGETTTVQTTTADAPIPTSEDLEKIEKRKAKKREKKERQKASKDATEKTAETSKADPVVSAPAKLAPQLTPLQASMRQKLVSARFRHLNQTLYTTPSSHSLSLFQENPEMFQEYHEGFRRQVEVWPENPVDSYIAEIRTRGKQIGPAKGKNKDQSKAKDPKEQDSNIIPLPRTEGTCYIADLGCGDAALSSNLEAEKKKLKLQIFSYDLQNPNPLVTKADIANLPLKDNSIDVAIFCLALMGTNWIDLIEEAHRILHWKGELWISEIKSRFSRIETSKNRIVSHSIGNRKKPDKKRLQKIEEEDNNAGLMVEVDGNTDKSQETDVSAFVEVLRKRGFVLRDGDEGMMKAVDLSNRMFVRLRFVKGVVPVKGKGVPIPKGMVEASWKPKVKERFVKGGEEGEGDDVHVSSEAGVLKPCVYKLR